MLKRALYRVVRPLRELLGKFVILPEPEDGTFIGQHGCINTAASFYTWNQVEGDYLEFGVYRGASFVTAYQSIQRARALHAPRAMGKSKEYLNWRQTRPRFFAFDSFEGLPPGSAQRQVDYEAGAYQCSEEGFRQSVIAGGVEPGEVVVVPGFYDQSLTTEAKQRHALRKAAIVMIDCDLYESTMPVLRFLTDIVGQGTILIFHDWFRFKGSPDQGEQRACREWLDANPHIELLEYWREGPQAVSFVVNLKASAAKSHRDRDARMKAVP